VAVNLHAGGGSAVNLDEAIDGIEEAGGAVEGALMTGKEPAVMPSDADMKDPAIGVPGKLVVAFTIGIEGEEVTVLVEGEVVVVAKSVGNDLALFPVRRDPENGSLGRVGDGGSRGGDVSPADFGVVSTGEVKPAIRSTTDAMGSMFAAPSGKLVEEFGVSPGKAIIGTGPMKKNPLGLDTEEIASAPEQAVGITGLVGDDFGTIGHPVVVGVEENLDVAGSGYGHPPVVRDGHGPGVVGEFISCKLRDGKALGDAERALGVQTARDQEDEDERTKHDDGHTLGNSPGDASPDQILRTIRAGWFAAAIPLVPEIVLR
tara:strand:- start:1188 stop:2138 length:951 start_codon:yes stop_codon:yes gene_type:complete